ncbi:MAG: chitobiase/beta-hexosaminidase C-terminal domain-containing protein [Verrucomicrobiae bacterium]|nr:chitobiase/beta-hexosaminidase C-terminal domain-containing protein [Verrucomicrobiae bacterium]
MLRTISILGERFGERIAAGFPRSLNLVAADMSPLQLMTGCKVTAAPRRRLRFLPDAACLAWSLLLLSPFIATAQTDPPPVSYVRSFINDVPDQPGVTVSVYGAAGVASFTIEERLPNPATARDISDGGVYLAEQNVIRWGPYSDMESVSVSYRLTGLPASYPVDGGAWMDGQWYFSPGVTLVTVLPATSDEELATPPERVATPEFDPVGGGNVPVAVTISCDTEDAVIYYTTDGSLPTDDGSGSSTLYTGAVPLETAGVIRAVAFKTDWTRSMASVAYYGPTAPPADAAVARSVTGNSTASPQVALNVAPGLSAQCVAVTETLPPGVRAESVTEGGYYDELKHVVRWGPFVGTIPESLSYTVQAPPGNYPVSAAWSVDGVSASEEGATSLIVVGPTADLASPPLRMPTPRIDPAIASIAQGGSVTVEISCADSTAQIRYTLDGSLPTESSTLYTPDETHLTFSERITLRAVAFPPAGSTDLSSMAAVGEYALEVITPEVMMDYSVSGEGGFSPTIVNTVAPGDAVDCYAVVETIPYGLLTSELSGDGNWDPIASEIRWGPYLDHAEREFSYNIEGASVSFPLSGRISVNGYSVATTDAAMVQIDENSTGSEPVTDLAACATIHLSYNVNINPAPGIITVTSASGTVNWGDGTTTAITTPAMTLQKAYSVPGTYDIVISAHWEGHNSAGVTKTGHATNVRKPDQIQVVTDCVAPQIVTQPYDQAVLVGSNVLFTVSASSSVPMGYQWYFNETFPIVGARASSLALPAVQAPSAGTYLVIITNVFGSVISDSATLTVVTPHSTGATIGSDGSISFTFKTLPYTSSRIWGATELRPPIEWQLLATVISDANGDCTFVDDEVADFPARFLTITTP